MSSAFHLVTSPLRIPVPGNKLIEEYLGGATSGHEAFSVAHMVAPAGWDEPRQTPSFGEITIMLRGLMQIEIGGESFELKAGQVVYIEPNHTVRYSNPSEEESEYWAICLPAFSPDAARREDD